ncbi:hypothetical protein C2845_PM06G05930 [Panicum miliaceum]|uniref:Uncharacterized protein n=1 Tax=Panicum miliaceum TaxID=4540 RepID=A0A3L6R865_PANMI|nr:hypothetical protein C2845_PM06G05930 [Panicum miliaceum]
MGDTAKLNPTSIEFCERRIRQLESQKEELEQTMEKNLVRQASPKRGKKHRKVVQDPEMRKGLVEQADLEVGKKHAMKIDSLEETIKFMKKRLRCLIMAADRSISLEAAQELVEKEEQEEKLKHKKQPAGEDSPESTTSEASPLPPPIHRHRPYPDGCNREEHQEWVQEYTRVQDLNAPTDNLPTQTDGHKDPATVAAAVDPDDKSKLINVAKSVVRVSFPPPNRGREYLDQWYTGVIISWDVDNKTAMILTGGCFGRDNDDKSKSKIFVHYPYMEDDGLIEENFSSSANSINFLCWRLLFRGCCWMYRHRPPLLVQPTQNVVMRYFHWVGTKICRWWSVVGQL